MENGLNITKKANMRIIDDLLIRIPDWENVLKQRHVKFVNCYLQNKKSINKVSKEFYFSEDDILTIFWRIQKQLQIEHSNRVFSNVLNKKIIFVKEK